ncbi:MAG: XamI family restriction endonuclease [Pseudomonadota bacterium]
MSDATTAEALYTDALTSSSAAHDWYAAVSISRRMVFAALRDTDYLKDIATGLRKSGIHAIVLRHMAGPPISQDQFALLCAAYPKGAEKAGRQFPSGAAAAVAETFLKVRDRRLTRWVDGGRRPTIAEVRAVVHSVAPLLSQQTVATLRRHRLSSAQEHAVINLLLGEGWDRIISGVVEQSSALPLRHFMHKTRFATMTRPQEVDIACGLGRSVVLAMECKVTNDRTNSVKRVNDILKKATAWQDHWGSFVRTAALLQGVIAERDVARLTAANVAVFWSHDLESFSEWLKRNIIE